LVNQKEDNRLDNNGLIQRKFLGQCTHIKKDGERCRAIANKETGLCSIHAGLVPRLEGQIDPAASVTHTKLFLDQIMKQVKDGKLTPQVGNTINALCNTIIKCQEIEIIEKYFADNLVPVNKEALEDEIPAEYLLEDE
jgi:hypothetical protein